MSDANLHFMPWLRTGTASELTNADPLSGALPAGGELSPWLRIAGNADIGQPARLHGPGHITGLGSHVVGRCQPVAGTSDFEPNYFAFVELTAADLPWRYTPAKPGAAGQLRPWLVLVVLRQQDGVRVGPEAGAPLPVLRIEPPATASTELPDLADSPAWVHVQSSVAAADLPATLATDPAAALARVLCPRRLLPRATWHACLVPGFDLGVRAGLGEDGAVAAQAAPAWDLADPDLDQATLRLPVYHHWTFSTGPDGDFESLARRLAPDDSGEILGRVDLDLSHPGPPLPDPPPRTVPANFVLADFVGGLKTPGVRRGGAPDGYQEWFEAGLQPLLDDGAQRVTVPAKAPADYDPLLDDPVVAPPLYGSLQAGRVKVPEGDTGPKGWLRTLALTPELRAVAGLGAEVVRIHQESFVASAWAQAGALRETEQALDQALLAVEAGRSLARRIQTLDGGTIVQVTRPVHAWVAVPGSADPLALELSRSAVPGGLVGAPFQRATRPRSTLARLWQTHPPLPEAGQADAQAPPLTPAATSVLVAATSPVANADLLVALEYAAFGLPVGAWTHDDALDTHEAGIAVRVPATVPTLVPATPAVDLSTSADSVVAGLDPLPAVHAGLLARVPALSGLLLDDGALPTSVVLHPIFPNPLYRDLVRLDPRFLLPGADLLANNRVGVLAVDDDFVAAFLAGANHELARELLWREFPTSPAYTFLHRFWDSGVDGPADIGEIVDWTHPRLGVNLTGASASALGVALVRGDLIRRYPDAHVYLTRGRWQAGAVVPDDATLSEPVLVGMLDSRSVFYGFPVTVSDMCGDRTSRTRTPETAGWYVTIEEPATGPRFGLDAAANDGSDLSDGAASWNDLSWGHLVPRNGSLDGVTHAVAREPLPPRTPLTIDGLTWGRNAAHLAAITWQRPYRVLIHADLLLPPG